MKIIKPMTMGVLHKAYGFKQQHYCVIAPVIFFRLTSKDNTASTPPFIQERILVESQQWPLIQAALGDSIFDLVMPKPKMEVLIAGSAVNPNPNSGQFQAHVQLSHKNAGALDWSWSKTLQLYGKRYWQKQFIGYQQTQAKPVTQVALDLQHAFGGEGLLENPQGLGYYQNKKQSALALAQIEDPNQPVTSIRQTSSPAGFGPLPITHPQREQFNGDYSNQEWLDLHFPDLAPDTDFQLFQAARVDQQFDIEFDGTEYYCLTHLHEDIAQLAGTLPGIRPRAFINDTQELELRLDTLWFFPNQQIGALIYRGQVPCVDPDALDIKQLMLAYENLNDAPRPISHYQTVLKERLDPELAALVAMDESQLTPEKSDAQKAQLEAEISEEAKVKHALLVEQQADLLEQVKAANNGKLPKGFEQLTPPTEPKVLVSQAAIDRGDFNLKALKQEADAQQAAAQAQKAELEAQQKQAQENLKALKSRVEASESPASTAKLPLMSEQVTALKNIKSTIPASAAQAIPDDALAQIEALQVKAGQYSVTPFEQWPEESLAQEKRAVFLQAWQQAQSQSEAERTALRQRDWSGCDLSGLDLSGWDLSHCNLQNCNLENTLFIGCNLECTSFVGAKLIGTQFDNANLKNANFSNSIGFENRFNHADLSHAFFIQSVLTQSQFVGCTLTKAQFLKADCSYSQFNQSRLDGVCMVQCQLFDCDLQQCQGQMLVLLQTNANVSRWHQSELSRCAFLECQLVLSGWAQTKLEKCQFSGGSQLTASQWHSAIAKECGLRRIQGTGMKTDHALFYQCDLGDSEFQHSACANTEFVGSILSDSNFAQSRLTHANFYQALMRKTQLNQCDLSYSQFYHADALLARVEGSEMSNVQNVAPVIQKRWQHQSNQVLAPSDNTSFEERISC
ncbi:DUF2169 family type VI secretion system accessory protein [Alteromonas sp. a30]|uniref:DUF2169 family type VI secretion system accessory protein n=1 Tax=Alteromonas sp. a30 TaxID=2730917 RepID=UPI00227FBC10|nr:DUF2169 domain-containing protein [Alteromonas sp. a30]MCY7293843.1 pentapeptide repeat-containing protein [Alteromonas sp. a30]